MKRKIMYKWLLKGTQTIVTDTGQPGSIVRPFIHSMWTNTNQTRQMKRLINFEIQKFLNDKVLKISIKDQNIIDQTEVVLT